MEILYQVGTDQLTFSLALAEILRGDYITLTLGLLFPNAEPRILVGYLSTLPFS